MSNSKERRPPMGSEKDIDNQATTNTSSRGQYTANSSSSSDEEPDELSLRVRALLAESDEEIPKFSSRKESPVHQVSQISPQFSETGFDSQAERKFEGTAQLGCHHHAGKTSFQKKEREHVSESQTHLKDSISKTDTFYDICESVSYSYSAEMIEEKEISFEEQTERYISEEIPEFSSLKESLVRQVSQISPQFSETGFDSQAEKKVEGTVQLRCHHHAGKTLKKKEREHVSESHTNLKDSTSDIFHDTCESVSYSFNTEIELTEEKEVSFEEQTERYISEDFLSSSDVIIEDSHPDIHQPSVKSNEELEISKVSSYYTVDDDLEKQHVDYHLKGRCCRADLPLLDSSFSTGTQFFYIPCEDEEKLSVDKSDFSSYSMASFSPQQSGDKEDKECPSWSRYSDRDTSSHLISSIASSKRLEWDSAADIGYAEDTVDENNSQMKSRREPEGFSLAAHKFSYSTSSKYSKTAPQQLSAKNTSIIYERKQPSQVSQSLDIRDRSLSSEGSISSIKKDFSKEDKSINEKTLQYSSAKSSMVTESISNSSKESKLQIHPDLSVRPKCRAYMKKDLSYERNMLPKDQSFVSERDTEYLKKKEPEISKSDFSESICQNIDSETSKERMSFVPSETFEGNVNIMNFIKPEGDTASARNFEPQLYQPISDLPEEFQRHILSGSIFIDSSMLASSEFSSRSVSDNRISSSDVLPHIRWYPFPLYTSPQDIRTAATQTSVRQSNEAGTSSEIPDELDQIFVESSDVVKHLHMRRSIDRNPVYLYSLPPEWHSSEGVKSPSPFTFKYIDDSDMRLRSSKSAKADVPSEFITTPQERNELNQNVIESSDVIKHMYMTRAIDKNPSSTCHELSQEITYENVEEMDFEPYGVGTIKVHDYASADAVASVFSSDSGDDADSPGIIIGSERDKQEFRDIPTAVKTKDASTQVNSKCNCLNDFKNMFRKALSEVPAERVCPLHKCLMKKLEIRRQARRIPLYSEGYDVLFFDDDTPKIMDAENSPLYFCGIFARHMRCVPKKSPKRVKKLPKKVKQWTQRERKEIEEKRKILRMLYRRKAKEFSRVLAKHVREGKVDHTLHEHVLKTSLWY